MTVAGRSAGMGRVPYSEWLCAANRIRDMNPTAVEVEGTMLLAPANPWDFEAYLLADFFCQVDDLVMRYTDPDYEDDEVDAPGGAPSSD